MLVLMLHKVFCNVERLIKLNLVYTGVASQHFFIANELAKVFQIYIFVGQKSKRYKLNSLYKKRPKM